MVQVAKFDQVLAYSPQGARCEYGSIFIFSFSHLSYYCGLTDCSVRRPFNLNYVHFKTKDLDKMQSRGDFWHLTIINGAVIVAQDEVDTYTIHRMAIPGADSQIESPVKFVKESLGGIGGEPFDIKIDEVLVSGKWQSDLSIADSFRSERGRVFLAGDAGT
jgi:hypothetical protein